MECRLNLVLGHIKVVKVEVHIQRIRLIK